MFRLNLVIDSNGNTQRQLVDNKRVFTTGNVEVFNDETGHKSLVHKSIYDQLKEFYVDLKGKTLGEQAEELCETIETSMNLEEIVTTMNKLTGEIK